MAGAFCFPSRKKEKTKQWLILLSSSLSCSSVQRDTVSQRVRTLFPSSSQTAGYVFDSTIHTYVVQWKEVISISPWDWPRGSRGIKFPFIDFDCTHARCGTCVLLGIAKVSKKSQFASSWTGLRNVREVCIEHRTVFRFVGHGRLQRGAKLSKTETISTLSGWILRIPPTTYVYMYKETLVSYYYNY